MKECCQVVGLLRNELGLSGELLLSDPLEASDNPRVIILHHLDLPLELRVELLHALVRIGQLLQLNFQRVGCDFWASMYNCSCTPSAVSNHLVKSRALPSASLLFEAILKATMPCAVADLDAA